MCSYVEHYLTHPNQQSQQTYSTYTGHRHLNMLNKGAKKRKEQQKKVKLRNSEKNTQAYDFQKNKIQKKNPEEPIDADIANMRKNNKT